MFIEIVECERDKANCELANANNVFENGQTDGPHSLNSTGETEKGGERQRNRSSRHSERVR